VRPGLKKFFGLVFSSSLKKIHAEGVPHRPTCIFDKHPGEGIVPPIAESRASRGGYSHSEHFAGEDIVLSIAKHVERH
jgi:hypothetical protein